MRPNIVLTGFMGSGKTSIGKKLSKILNMDFIDTDELIVRKAGMSINEIFEKFGENHFRALETEITKDCTKLNDKIISTGGGIVLNEENMINLEKAGMVALLWAEPSTIYERVRYCKNRPLLNVEEPYKKIVEMLEYRKTFYEKYYDVKVLTDDRLIVEIAEEIKMAYLND